MMILNMYYPIPACEPQSSQEISRSPSTPPYFVSKSLRNDQDERREFFLSAPAGKMIAVKCMVESEKECEDKRGGNRFEAQVREEKTIGDKMNPEGEHNRI